jgi:hypothetical protein
MTYVKNITQLLQGCSSEVRASPLLNLMKWMMFVIFYAASFAEQMLEHAVQTPIFPILLLARLACHHPWRCLHVKQFKKIVVLMRFPVQQEVNLGLQYHS